MYLACHWHFEKGEVDGRRTPLGSNPFKRRNGVVWNLATLCCHGARGLEHSYASLTDRTAFCRADGVGAHLGGNNPLRRIQPSQELHKAVQGQEVASSSLT